MNSAVAGGVPPTLDARIRASIREVADFPITGVRFKDLTPLLADAALFGEIVDTLARTCSGLRPTHVAAIESRGFLLGAPLALRLGCALVPVRKVGKLPWRTERVEYALEYGAAALEVHVDAWGPGDRVLMVDDVLATGGTAAAACDLVERLGASVVATSFLLSLPGLGGEQRLEPRLVRALVRY